MGGPAVDRRVRRGIVLPLAALTDPATDDHSPTTPIGYRDHGRCRGPFCAAPPPDAVTVPDVEVTGVVGRTPGGRLSTPVLGGQPGGVCGPGRPGFLVIDPPPMNSTKRYVMRRLVLPALPLIALLGLSLPGTADAATAPTYTVTRTAGPFDGAAGIGQNHSVPDGEALVVNCRPDDTALRGSATINRRTSHGTSAKVLRIGGHGVTFDADSGYSQFHAFVTATGKKGWNSVTLTVTCRDD